MKKRIWLAFLVMVLAVSSVSGCGNKGESNVTTAPNVETSPIKIVNELFKEYKTFNYEGIEKYAIGQALENANDELMKAESSVLNTEFIKSYSLKTTGQLVREEEATVHVTLSMPDYITLMVLAVDNVVKMMEDGLDSKGEAVLHLIENIILENMDKVKHIEVEGSVVLKKVEDQWKVSEFIEAVQASMDLEELLTEDEIRTYVGSIWKMFAISWGATLDDIKEINSETQKVPYEDILAEFRNHHP